MHVCMYVMYVIPLCMQDSIQKKNLLLVLYMYPLYFYFSMAARVAVAWSAADARQRAVAGCFAASRTRCVRWRRSINPRSRAADQSTHAPLFDHLRPSSLRGVNLFRFARVRSTGRSCIASTVRAGSRPPSQGVARCCFPRRLSARRVHLRCYAVISSRLLSTVGHGRLSNCAGMISMPLCALATDRSQRWTRNWVCKGG